MLKIHWVKWENLIQSKSEGGMGSKDLALFNDAFVWERQTWVPLKKRRDFWVFLRAPLFLGKRCEVATYFLYKKIRKTKYKNTWLNCFLSLIKKIHVWKIENYMALGSSYKLPNKYMAFCPSYNLPKIKAKIRPRSTYQKN